MKVGDLIKELQKWGDQAEVVINGQEVHGVTSYRARRKPTGPGSEFHYTTNENGNYRVVTLTHFTEYSDGQYDQSRTWT